MEQLLRILLERLELIGESHEELYDSDVRQQMSNVIVDGFVRERENYVLPDEVAMFSAQANSDVIAPLKEYVLGEEKRGHSTFICIPPTPEIL